MDFIFNLKKYGLNMEQITAFYGVEDQNIRYIESVFDVNIHGNGELLTIQAENEETLEKVKTTLNILLENVLKEIEIDKMSLDQLIKSVNSNQVFHGDDLKFVTTYQRKIIRPKTKGQVEYYQALEKNTIIFATGAAGTGKTYLAVAYAVDQYKKHKVEKIIITRPIVEAGENLGFLPGELKEKVDPYLIPIYDSLNSILGVENTKKLIEKEIIEIAPLAYMRGRTLSDAVIILDEAQNTTPIQMKMFLTRLGYNAKMIITGDESQTDLKEKVKSGLIHAKEILQNIDQIAFIAFSSQDVVRHPLVGKIINAYETKK